MITAKVESQDLQKALKDIDKYHDKAKQGISNEVSRAAFNIAHKARIAAPVGKAKGAGGRLRASISVADQKRFEAKVVAKTRYAAYVEFGTGTLVKVPKGLEDYAMQFKGRGIRQVNLRARPFLFPSVESERNTYESNMNKLLGIVPR